MKNSSTVLRSESSVNQASKKGLENIKINRERRNEDIFQNGVALINQLKKQPIKRFFLYPSLPKEINMKTVKDWMFEIDGWMIDPKYYYRDDEIALKRLVIATDKSELYVMMNLSTEDAALLDRWSTPD